MSEVVLRVFFDESGKKRDKPNLMGGLSIPGELYTSENFAGLNQKLKDGLSLHFKDYTGYSKMRENIIEVIQVLTRYRHMVKFFVINYDYTMVANHRGFKEDLTEKTIYTKFPERIIYGLLRGYGKNSYVKVQIDIEKAQEYETFHLEHVIKEQLNIQSLYRGEQFVIEETRLVEKGEEIGLEMTDLLLGIIRTIILNKENGTKGAAEKNHLVVELLKNHEFFSFIENVRLFEWTKTKELGDVNMIDYLQLFMARHHALFD